MGLVASPATAYPKDQTTGKNSRIEPRVNIQNDKGKAKAYQVKQVLLAIERLGVK